jgi:DSBA-like thioredoxin domain
MLTVDPKPATATWYFDVISPFAYLALGEIEDLTKSVAIAYRPILFAGLLQHWKHLGPAEIPPKRIHTYRLCVFEAQRRGIPFRFPPTHPFNPLKPQRLLTALKADPRAVRTVMDGILARRARPRYRGELERDVHSARARCCCGRVTCRRSGNKGHAAIQHGRRDRRQALRRPYIADRRRTFLGC